MSDIIEKGIYFAKKEFYEVIKRQKGTWTDTKERPLVALLQSTDHPEIYWAVPMGDWNHRDSKQKDRIQKYLDKDAKDITSCYYHVGKTDKKSIFFISDAIPITAKYIERQYLVGPKSNQNQYVIKNKSIINELNRKLGRIISFEKNYYNSKGEYKFRQNMLGVYSYLLSEIVVNTDVTEPL